MRCIHYYAKPQLSPSITWPVPQLCAAYDWPTSLAGGGIIAIVELGGGYRMSDVEMFCKMNNLPVPTIVDIDAGGRNLPGFSDADGEVALDIQVVLAAYSVATGKPATILMVWANDIASGVRATVKDGRASTISISWGAEEPVWGPVALNDMEAASQEAISAGMVVFAASGDNDADDGGGSPGVDAPASCPHVIACGGTKKMPDSEIVWNDEPGDASGSGTGGGRSSHFPLPAWQTGIPLPLHGLGQGRMVPDVAANADPVTGYLIVLDGQLQSIGGTSAVAPLYAGLFASFGAKLGSIVPTLWQHRECFNDITAGDNGIYHAQVGPDPCTGLGSPIGSRLAKLFEPKIDLSARVEKLEAMVEQMMRNGTK